MQSETMDLLNSHKLSQKIVTLGQSGCFLILGKHRCHKWIVSDAMSGTVGILSDILTKYFTLTQQLYERLFYKYVELIRDEQNTWWESISCCYGLLNALTPHMVSLQLNYQHEFCLSMFNIKSLLTPFVRFLPYLVKVTRWSDVEEL